MAIFLRFGFQEKCLKFFPVLKKTVKCKYFMCHLIICKSFTSKIFYLRLPRLFLRVMNVVDFSRFCLCFLFKFKIKTIYPRGRTNTRAVQLITANRCCTPVLTTCSFFGYFSGLGKIASPSSNEHGSWWASNIRPFD